jgi:hypothetical protein
VDKGERARSLSHSALLFKGTVMIRVLDGGVDTLYWSAAPVVGSWYGDATRARVAATHESRALPWREVRGYAFEVLPHGMGMYPVVARAAEFDLRLTDAQHIPSVFVQLRASFIHAHGVELASAESIAVVSEIVGAQIRDAKPARVDVFADFGEWRLTSGDRAGFHTRAGIAAFFKGGTEGLPSIRAGTSRFKLRVYDKRLERLRRAKPMPLAWDGFAGDVTRVEVEADGPALRRFGISTVAEAIGSYGDLWRYGTRRFFVLRMPAEGPMRSWPVREEWRVVQEAGLGYPANGLIPFHEAKGDKMRALRVVYGGLVTVGAHLREGDLERVLKALPDELEVVRRGRSFRDEVRRRWKRFPLAVRERSGR